MGYYTNFNVEIECNTENLTIIKDYLVNKLDVFYNKYNSFEENDGILEIDLNQEKWYKCEEDIKLASKEFPQAEFYIHGEGEEREDVWEIKAVNGILQRRDIELNWKAWH